MARKPSADKTAAALCLVLMGCNPGKPRSSEAHATLPPPLALPTDTARTEGPATEAQKAPVPCPRYRAPVAHGTLHEPPLSEISGLAASVEAPGVFWVHNDSGDQARVYALSLQAEWLATFRLPTVAKPKDAEDIALVRVGDRSTIYLGDIGDNQRGRMSGVRLHRFDEPRLVRSGSMPPRNREQSTSPVATATLRYPDGPQDAEALLIDPRTEAIVIVTKAFLGSPRVYFQETFADQARLTLAGEMTADVTGVSLRMVTAADVSASGAYVGVRTYGEAFLFRRAPGQSLAAALLGPACPVPVADERQGEALALLERAGGPPAFATMSEGKVSALWITEPE
jgi:hypothetical protein